MSHQDPLNYVPFVTNSGGIKDDSYGGWKASVQIADRFDSPLNGRRT